MANIIIRTHNPNSNSQQLKLSTAERQVSTIQASSNTQYELIDEATGLAPAKAVMRRIGDDMQMSFDDVVRETDLIIKDYYKNTNQVIVGQTENGVFQNYLPVTGETNEYTAQISNMQSNSPIIQVIEPAPFWTTLGTDQPWWIAGLGAFVWVASRNSNNVNDDSENAAPVLNVTEFNSFVANDTNATVGAIVATYTATDADEDSVTVTLSDTDNYELDDSGNVILSQKGVEVINGGNMLPLFTLTPNDGKVDGAQVTVNPTVNSAVTATVTTQNDFIEDDAATKADAVVATYTTEGSGTITVKLSDVVNYALDDKGNVILTEVGAELANSGKELPDFTITPLDGVQQGVAVTVDPKVTFINDAPILTVTETTEFIQSDKNIKVGDVVAEYTTVDEEDGTAEIVSLSDTINYKLDNKGNVVLTQKGVELISSGEELPAFKLIPNDNTINGATVLVGPEINSTPTLVITKTTDFTQNDAATKAGAVVSTFTTNDIDSPNVTVVLSDEMSYALDGNGNVVLTEAGAVLANGGQDLPEFTLTPKDEAQDGESVSADPKVTLLNNNAPTLTITETNEFTQSDASTVEGAVVSKYTIVDEDPSMVSIDLSDRDNYALDNAGNVTLTQKGVALINSGVELPEFTLTPTDAAQQTGSPVSTKPVVNLTTTTTSMAQDAEVTVSNLSTIYILETEDVSETMGLNDLVTSSNDVLYSGSITSSGLQDMSLNAHQTNHSVDTYDNGAIHYVNTTVVHPDLINLDLSPIFG